MKLISFAIPSYNSENYLRHAVDTILTGGEDVEILIVNDGSTDGTAAIADEYADRYPTIVRAIHKPNGGHGSGVNRGLQEASGLYYKVVDSDDWVDEKSLRELVLTVKGHVSRGLGADLYFTNYVYDHAEDGKTNVRHWRSNFPVNRFFSWDEVKPFYGVQYLMMHSLMYRTQLLRDCGIVLPEHTFYVDNYYAYMPLPHTRKLFYLDVDLYHYFIGRADQSVNIQNLTKRYDQQLRVTKLILDAYTYDEIMTFDVGLCKYMRHCLGAIMIITDMVCCCGEDTPQRRADNRGIWEYIREKDPDMYGFLRGRAMSGPLVRLPWKLRGKVMLGGYKAACKLFKLG